ncbi:hypothetical protein EIP86_000810 [Pleurotus ostreatoroseus]|nr:hypothetical protein EIP86_000810 [Pleurotus ostreatoroseus]
MFRVALLRATTRASVRSTVSLRATGPAMRFVRFESNEAQGSRRQLLEARDELQRDWDAKEITYETLKPRTLQPTPVRTCLESICISLMRSQDAYLIDVREKDEVMQGAIPSAVNVPLTVLSGAFGLRDADFDRIYGFPKPKPEQEIIFYCRSGKRSTTACDVAKRNGYKNILNYKGSWLDWVQQEGTNKSP